MRLYLNFPRPSPDMLGIYDRLRQLAIEPISTWPFMPPWEGDREGAVARNKTNDEEIAGAAAMLVDARFGHAVGLCVTRYADPMVFVRVGQAAEIRMPVLWVGPAAEVCFQRAFRVVTDLPEAFTLLESWRARLGTGIPNEYARKALFTYLEAEDHRREHSSP